MRAIHRLGAVFLALIVLVGCAVPTSTPAPTPTDAPSPTPAATLPDWILPYLHVGMNAWSIPHLLDASAMHLLATDPLLDEFVYQFASGTVVRLGYDRTYPELLVITSVQMDGEAAVTPVADASPVHDTRVDLGGLVFVPGADVTIDAMKSALGAPLEDRTVKVTEVGYGDAPHWQRSVTYSGCKVGLRQLLEATDKSIWTFDVVGVTSPDILSARGLAIGMDAAEVLDLYGVVGLYMERSWPSDGFDSLYIRRYLGITTEGGTLYVSFKEGKVESWSVFISHAD